MRVLICPPIYPLAPGVVNRIERQGRGWRAPECAFTVAARRIGHKAGRYNCGVWEIVGHRQIVDGIERALNSGRFPHALLFTGPNAVGKTALALELAKRLNCIGDSPPCGQCLHCRQITGGSHPDVSIVERPEARESIAIQQVRDLRDAASLRPFQGRWKVYIIASAESLTPQAADALLKTLEEPQPQVTIILTASEADAVPGTIVSRCRVFPFTGVERAMIEDALRERGATPDAAGSIARLAQGRPGWAFRALASPKVLQQQEEMIRRLMSVPAMSLDDRLQLAETLAAEKKDRAAIRRNLELLLLLTRDQLFASQGMAPQIATRSHDGLGQTARQYTLADIHAALRGIRLAMLRIDQNVDPRLTLEALLVSLP